MNDVELMGKIKNIQGLLWRPFVDELLIRSKKWFQDQDHAADYIKQLERERDEALAAQSYTYIGKDMKPILARDLEDAKDFAEAKLAKAVEVLRDIASDCEADYPPSHGSIKFAISLVLAELEEIK